MYHKHCRDFASAGEASMERLFDQVQRDQYLLPVARCCGCGCTSSGWFVPIVLNREHEHQRKPFPTHGRDGCKAPAARFDACAARSLKPYHSEALGHFVPETWCISGLRCHVHLPQVAIYLLCRASSRLFNKPMISNFSLEIVQ